MKQFISWAIIKRLTESESILLKRGMEAHFRARLQPYFQWQADKICSKEIVAGEMPLSKPFLKETKTSNKLLVLPKV